MNEQNEIHCEGNNLTLEVNYIPQILMPITCKLRINWTKDNKTLSGMVIEESLLLHRFEIGTCTLLAEGKDEHGLGILVGVRHGRKGSSTAMNLFRILQSEKSKKQAILIFS